MNTIQTLIPVVFSDLFAYSRAFRGPLAIKDYPLYSLSAAHDQLQIQLYFRETLQWCPVPPWKGHRAVSGRIETSAVVLELLSNNRQNRQ
jgi:hypothetical protein